ncbi:hypothetical protein [Macrococcoides canis]|uniref:Uncharacterized protein n=1 Tax=Macrococcoides canis TaxID=1855823 RepID=A0A1W7AB45_9STAP|nr:hypothetical protein [Macrococcus canis]ARQ06808.1 hypothetical protein MCCS_11620 [Macrococcus canis]UTH01123.1 hypothetical protein KFV04_05550 [Macrococcus canis]UTH12602.1 hypothetical protein KFV10_05740 [Macrococcus canis]WBF51857.1 hypothetical protein LL975_07040 [Macrococcus canis]
MKEEFIIMKLTLIFSYVLLLFVLRYGFEIINDQVTLLLLIVGLALFGFSNRKK